MRQKLIILAIFGAVLGSVAPAAAITSQQFNCEKAALLELGKMSRARGKCITRCVGKKQASPLLYTCSPPFDFSTNTCTLDSETKYLEQIALKCTANMPPCGGYLKGFCSQNTSQTCSNDGGTYGGDCTGISNLCRGRCSTTTSESCSVDSDCVPGTNCPTCVPSETCTHDTTTKDPVGFAQGNIYDGDPLSVIQQIDLFAEGLFLCRQKVCSNNGDLCASDGDCGGGSCDAGDCETGGADCDYDGECSTPKKCLARGRCSATPQACNLGGGTACPMGETCLRYGRCTDGTTPPGSQSICFADAECLLGETCDRSLTQTDRKRELLCTQAINSNLAKLTFDIFNCETKCGLERDLKTSLSAKPKGRCQGDTSVLCELPPEADTCGVNAPCQPTSCDHFAIGRCSGGHPADDQVCADDSDCPLANQPCNATPTAPVSQALLDCRTKAFALAKKLITKKCPALSSTPEAPLASLPACGVYSHQGSPVGFQYTADALLSFVSDAQDGQFKEDNPDNSPGSNMCLQ